MRTKPVMDHHGSQRTHNGKQNHEGSDTGNVIRQRDVHHLPAADCAVAPRGQTKWLRNVFAARVAVVPANGATSVPAPHGRKMTALSLHRPDSEQHNITIMVHRCTMMMRIRPDALPKPRPIGAAGLSVRKRAINLPNWRNVPQQ